MFNLQKMLRVSNPKKQELKERATYDGLWTIPDDFELSDEFAQAFERIEQSKVNYFVTGKPGAGKTTFLNYYCKNKTKNVVVLAPTGMASLQAGGQTIHSFFQFPPRFIRPEDIKIIHRHKNVMKNLDTLIIDEASMVRADILDCIDDSLRLNRGRMDEPFGGVQIIMIGDLFQLALLWAKIVQ